MKNSKGIVLIITLMFLAGISFMTSNLYLNSIKEQKLNKTLNIRLQEELLLTKMIKFIPSFLSLYQKHYEYIPSKIFLSFTKGKINLVISSEEDRFNINDLPPEDLFLLFLDLGISEKEALFIRDEICDWRDKDDQPRPFGKEIYKNYIAANRPFKNFFELLFLDHLNAYILWNVLLDRITIYGGQKEYTQINTQEYKKEKKIKLEQNKYYRVLINIEWKKIKNKYLIIFQPNKKIIDFFQIY